MLFAISGCANPENDGALRSLPVQDINTSLYFITVDRKNRALRRLGQRVPRYSKVLQVPLVAAFRVRAASVNMNLHGFWWAREAGVRSSTPGCGSSSSERVTRDSAAPPDIRLMCVDRRERSCSWRCWSCCGCHC